MLTAARLSQLSLELRACLAGSGGMDAAMSREQRRAGGVFFTPEPLVRFVTAGTIGARWDREPPGWRRDGSPHLLVVDPAAGDGRFLAAAADDLARRAVARGFDPAAARRAIVGRCLLGLERDSELAAAARHRLGPGARVHCCEALLDAPDEVRAADVIVGNPPYLRSINFAETDPALWRAVRGRYAATSHGEWDLYAAFLEQTLEWIQPGGEVGLVVPSRWLTARFAERLRAKLVGLAAVRAIVDFGAEQVFPGATTYASVAFLSRTSQRSVAVARHREGAWQCGRVDVGSLGGAPWRLSVGARRAMLERLSSAGPRLGAVARIAKGAGTNADRVYLLERATRSGQRVTGYSRQLGDTVTVESRFVRPCIRGRDVRAYGDVDQTVQCVVPYTREGELVDPERLASEGPRLMAYLIRCRERLDARERGRFRGDTFYRFGRPQNMAFLGEASAKVVVPDVARGGRAMLDVSGAMVLDSAYAIRLHQPNTDVLLGLVLAVMNSPMVALWLRETGVPLRGGYTRLKTAYLQSLPLPGPSPARDAVVAAVTGRAPAEQVSELVRVAYDVASEDWSSSAAAASSSSTDAT